MADTLSTTSTLDNLLPIYLERRLIARLVPVERFYQFASKRPLPPNEGKQMTFNGWVNLAAASATLAEGVPNSLTALSARKVNVTVSQYGRGVKVTDLAQLTTITDTIRDSADILATSAALTLDNVCQLPIFQNVLARVGSFSGGKTASLSAWVSATASSFAANTGTSSNSKQWGFPAVLGVGSATRLSAISKTAPTASARGSVYTIRKARNVLSKKDALPFADGMFVGIAHPNFLDTIGRDGAWKEWNQYTNAQLMYKGERGSIEMVRFVQSTNVPRYAVAAHSINMTPIFGQESYAATELDGGIKMLVKNPGPQSTENPFDQYSTIAYKLTAVGAVLNPSAGVNLFTEELVG